MTRVLAALGVLGLGALGVWWLAQSRPAVGAGTGAIRSLGCGCSKPLPAVGDPKGHITASALRGVRRRKK